MCLQCQVLQRISCDQLLGKDYGGLDKWMESNRDRVDGIKLRIAVSDRLQWRKLEMNSSLA